MPSRVLGSSVFASAPCRPAQPVRALGLKDMMANRFGVKPNCLVNALRKGRDASGALSRVGMVMRDMGTSTIGAGLTVIHIKAARSAVREGRSTWLLYL